MQYLTKYFLFVVIFYISGSSILYSQNSNPFEIPSRLDSVSRLPVIPTLDTLSSPSLKLPGENVLNSSLPDSTQIKDMNPFDVDHLPLRKSKALQNETEIDTLNPDTDRSKKSHNFIFWILLLASGLLAIVINVSFSTIRLVFRSLININLFKLFHRDEGNHFSLSQMFLYLVFFINAATLIFLFVIKENQQLTLNDWGYILLSITGFYLAKHILIFIIGNIFSIQKTTSLYSFSIFSYHIFAGIILLPLNLTAAFAPQGISTFLLYLSVVFVSFVVILKVGRGLFISLDFWNDRFFQFFMYLCTFEILPVLVLVKFLYQGNL